MPEKAQDLYGTMGSVPTVSPDNTPNHTFSVHSDPNDFGAQVGQAVEKSGDVQQKIGSQIVDQAIKTQGMINETEITNGDIDFAKKAGAIKAQYMTLTGLAANQAFPKYQQDLESALQDTKKSMSPAVARGFDMLARRTAANHIIDGSSYAASQLKNAQRDSASNLMDISVNSSGQPEVANNPDRFNEHLGTIKYAAAMQADSMGGLTTHDDGTMSFAEETPEGKLAKATHDDTVNHAVGLAWENRLNTLSDQNPVQASQVFKDNKDNIPIDSAVRIEASLSPKIQNYHAQTVTGTVMTDANVAHQQYLTNPSSAGSNAYNLGNVKTASAAANNTSGFVQPATPVDGVVLTANNLRKNYQGLTLAQIGNKWAPPSENKTSDWVKNVSTASGISSDTVPDLNDPATLSKVLKGIATAEKSPKDRANFTDDIISQGVTASIGGQQPNTVEKTQAQENKPYATNPDGSPVSRADYYAAHKDQIIAAGDRYAEQTMPGDLEFKNIVRQRISNQIDTAQSSQAAQYKQDNNYIQKGITGALSNGQAPTTYEELAALPGMNDILNRAAVHSPEYTKGIDTQIEKMARRAYNVNGPNSYDTAMRSLEPYDQQHPNAIYSQDHLDKLLGRSDGTGINVKDYNDVKKVIDTPDSWKGFLKTQMAQIAKANGNVDGQGPQRAMSFFNNANKMREERLAKGAAEEDLIDPESDQYVGKTTVAHTPSTMEQISNWVKNLGSKPTTEIPTISSPSEPAFAALPSGAQFKIPGDNQVRTKH